MANKRIQQKQMKHQKEKTIDDYEKYLLDLIITEREKNWALPHGPLSREERDKTRSKIFTLSTMHQHLRDFQLNK